MVRRVEEDKVESVRVREGDGGGGNWREAGEGSSGGAGEEERVERREEVSDRRVGVSMSEDDEGSGRAI